MSQNTPITNAVAALMESKKYSDLQITCGDRTFNVHRNIICTQSQIFGRMVDGDFKEAKTGRIELFEDDPDDVVRMVQFFYRHDYSDDPDDAALAGEASEGEATVTVTVDLTGTVTNDKLKKQLVNVAMYALGEKYLVAELKTLALRKFTSQPQTWTHGLPEVMREVYTTTPPSDRALRSAAALAVVSSGYPDDDESMAIFYADHPEAHVDILTEKLSGKDAVITSMSYALDDSEGRVRKAQGIIEQQSKYIETQKQLVVAQEEVNKAALQESKDADAKGRTMWGQVVQKVNRGQCRHTGCLQRFNVFVDNSSNYDDGVCILRCRQCRTKH